MLFVGLLALLAVIAGVAAVIVIASRQSTDEPPPSEPSDFVAPVSSGGYAWRGVDETAEEFKRRIARENAHQSPGR